MPRTRLQSKRGSNKGFHRCHDSPAMLNLSERLATHRLAEEAEMTRLMVGDDTQARGFPLEARIGVMRLTLRRISQYEQSIFLRPIEVHPKNGD